MHNPPPPPSPPLPPVAGMDSIDDSSTSIWDWSQFLDFNIDDHLPLPSPPIPAIQELPPIDHLPVIDSLPLNSSSNSNDRVRKRDPRMVCSNFLAGRIPCACPELDAELAAEEENAGPGKKRAKTLASARCQVPGCEVDISELKGYHRRHRVCLRCANAATVVLDGHNKRYCQQCGKFHLLSDFDEGKRSCRRKLERHNNRRRRKSTDTKGSGERELQTEDYGGCDDEAGKGANHMSSEVTEGEKSLLTAEGHNIIPSSTQSQNVQSDSIASLPASGETQTDGEKEKCTRSPSYCDDKSAFSSVCPTGRISFKLYDWNPAEFPRRLRHQIFQWLASMPVELEGYIRPGCIILTLFIAMPRFMWLKLTEDPVVSIHDLLASPRSMLSGRGTFFVHLNGTIFRVTRDGMSVMKVKVEEQAPKLHYIHPACFEAGKPIEFLACGSNLLQPRLRFLVSFAGKYLANDVCDSLLCNTTEDSATTFEHQLLNIRVHDTEPDVFGPGFIEVENESGLSNFIPILVADGEICSEIKIMQMKFYSSLDSRGGLQSTTAPSISCEVAVFRQNEFSELLLDMAWLLKQPVVEDIGHTMISSQLQRFTGVLNFLIEYDSTTVLQRVLHCVKMRNIKSLPAGILEADRVLFQGTVNHATEVLRQRLKRKINLISHPRDLWQADDQYKETEVTASKMSTLAKKNEAIPFINEDCIMSVSFCKEQPERRSNVNFTNKPNRFLASRPLMYIVAMAAVCFGVCAVVFHPHKATAIATSIRRCLFDN